VVLLSAAALPWFSDGIEPILEYREGAREAGFYPVDPIYPWFRDEITSPRVVLAPDLMGARIPAYSAQANVVSRRGSLVLDVLPKLEERVPGRIEVPRGAVDVREFFNGTSLGRGAEILRRYDVDLVMVKADSSLDAALGRLPGFRPRDEPSDRYNVYAVNLQKVGTPSPVTPRQSLQ
jgi:hypothetical protein